jgi:hypothetical protein
MPQSPRTAQLPLSVRSPKNHRWTGFWRIVPSPRPAAEWLPGSTSEIAAPRMLYECRQKNGRTLLYPYKILNLFPPGQRSSRDGEGMPESPDVHLRRGRPRRLHEMHASEAVWINTTTANAAQVEMPEQVYKMKTQPVVGPTSLTSGARRLPSSYANTRGCRKSQRAAGLP